MNILCKVFSHFPGAIQLVADAVPCRLQSFLSTYFCTNHNCTVSDWLPCFQCW